MSDPPRVNIASHVSVMARRQPDVPAVYAPAGRGQFVPWSFRRLEEESDCLARGLETVGIRRHVRTVLMVPPGLEFFALTFALFKVGAVPVVMDPGMGVKNLGRCLADAEAEAFIGIPRAHAARVLLGWGRGPLRVRVTVGRRMFWGGHNLDDIRAAGRSARSPIRIRCWASPSGSSRRSRCRRGMRGSDWGAAGRRGRRVRLRLC